MSAPRVRSGTRLRLRALLAACLLALAGCQSVPTTPLPLADDVDLERFAGDWYVIGGILTPFENGAHNAIERYRFVAPDVMETTFDFRRGAPDGEQVTYTPTGHVLPGTGNAVWKMNFFGPFGADYRIVDVRGSAPAPYDFTIVGRQKRDYVWVMARTPSFSAARWETVLLELEALGYEIADARRVPQRWSQSP